MTTCYLNGEFLPLEEAKVSVLDRGFIFGDGVYEVIPVFNGYLFRLDHHLERLKHSLGAVRINTAMNDIAEWKGFLMELVSRNGGGDQSLYVQVTRGVAKRDHLPSSDLVPTVFAMSTPLDKSRAGMPVKAITCEDIRWKLCHIKAITLLPNILLRLQAAEYDAYEAILIRDGLVTEGAASNVFIVSKGMVKTPPKGHRLLPGITRDLVAELLVRSHIPFEEVDFTAQELREADEIWLTSSTREILPVVQLDGEQVGSGEPGLGWQKTTEIYQKFKSMVIDADSQT